MAPTRDFKETIRARVKARSWFPQGAPSRGNRNFLSGIFLSDRLELCQSRRKGSSNFSEML